MASHSNLFDHITPIGKLLNLANKGSTKITGVGDVRMRVNNHCGSIKVNLDKVYHVPDLRTNLLSVSKITNKDHEVLFRKNDATVINKDKQMVLTAKRKEICIM